MMHADLRPMKTRSSRQAHATKGSLLEAQQVGSCAVDEPHNYVHC